MSLSWKLTNYHVKKKKKIQDYLFSLKAVTEVFDFVFIGEPCSIFLVSLAQFLIKCLKTTHLVNISCSPSLFHFSPFTVFLSAISSMKVY